MLRAILFDLDDTLCDDVAAAEQSIRETAAHASRELPGLDADALTAAFLRLYHEHWHAIDLIKPPSLQEVRTFLWKGALDACVQGSCDPAVVDAVVALYVDLRRSGVQLFPDALPTLDALRARGFRLGLVTNGVSETHAEKIVALGIREQFDAVLMPDVIGYAKPDVRVFHTACAQLGVAPHEAAMVGDSALSDVGGAKGAGLFAVWYNPDGRPFPSQTQRPDAEIGALRDLLAVVTSGGDGPAVSRT